MNLREVNPKINNDLWNDALIERFHEKYPDRDICTKVLTAEMWLEVDKIREIYEGHKEWQWRFGQTPDFSHNIRYAISANYSATSSHGR